MAVRLNIKNAEFISSCFFLGPLSIIVDLLLTQLSHNNCYYYDVYFIFNIILSTVQRLALMLCLSRMPHFKIILLIDGLHVKLSEMFFFLNEKVS